MESSARARGFELTAYPVSTGGAIDVAFQRIESSQPERIYVGYSQLTLRESGQIVAFVNRIRVPNVFNGHPHVIDGGMLSWS